MEILPTRPYLEQAARWPTAGRHILAHYDDASIVVYQAYRPSTGQHALAHQSFGVPGFSFSRMSWIKPNFLWMMYRSAWGTAEAQTAVLGVRLRRPFFDRLLTEAVPSSHVPGKYESSEAWQAAVARSNVRLQWDPDHDPCGGKLERQAIQLGLRGEALRAYATQEILEILDMTELVTAQRVNAERGAWTKLLTPEERPYVPADPSATQNVGLDAI